MNAIIHKAAVGVQHSAGTSFNLLPTAGQIAFSWDETIDKKEDEFFKVEGKLMDQPKSTILIKVD